MDYTQVTTPTNYLEEQAWKCPPVYPDTRNEFSHLPLQLLKSSQGGTYKKNLDLFLNAGERYAWKAAGYTVDTSEFDRPILVVEKNDESGEITPYQEEEIIWEEKKSPWVHNPEDAGHILVRKRIIHLPEAPKENETEIEVD